VRQLEDVVDTLAGLSLFGDLSRPQLEAVSHTFEEASFAQGERILRQGFTGSNFFVILEGEVSVRIDGQDRATLGRGEFFGELSLLLDEPPAADVVALRPLRTLYLAGPQLHGFLTAHPQVAYRMLQSLARRLRAANRWRS
jgi:CRP-like cAMP-binding protein